MELPSAGGRRSAQVERRGTVGRRSIQDALVASLFDGRFRERSDCDGGRDAKKQQVREERMEARDFKKALEVPVCTSHVEAFDDVSFSSNAREKKRWRGPIKCPGLVHKS